MMDPVHGPRKRGIATSWARGAAAERAGAPFWAQRAAGHVLSASEIGRAGCFTMVNSKIAIKKDTSDNRTWQLKSYSSVINKMFCLCQNHGKAKGELFYPSIFLGDYSTYRPKILSTKNCEGLKASYKPSTTPSTCHQCSGASFPNDASHSAGMDRPFSTKDEKEVVTIFCFGPAVMVRMMNSPLKN